MSRADQYTFSSADIWFARFMVKTMGGSDRLKFYKKLAALLRNNFTLMDALDRLWNIESKEGTKPSEPMAIAISSFQKKLENGESFAEALEGWVPQREQLMLSVGDVSRLEVALVHVIKVSEGSSRIIGPLINALMYPMFLLLLVFLIIIMVSLYLVPPLIQAAGKNVIWTGSASTLVTVSAFITQYWWVFPAVMGVMIAFMGISMSILIGPIRVILDKIPPWSLYRVFSGVSWLLALSSLIKSGTPIAQSLALLRDNSAPYLKEKIDHTLAFISEGENLGDALAHTGLHFPDDELIGDLRIYSELDSFEDALENVADDYLEDAILKIESIAGILNSFAILLVAVVIGWVVFGTFDMQEQLTKQM